MTDHPTQFATEREFTDWYNSLSNTVPEGTTVGQVLDSIAESKLPIYYGDMFHLRYVEDDPSGYRYHFELQACAVGEAAWALGAKPDAVVSFLDGSDCFLDWQTYYWDPHPDLKALSSSIIHVNDSLKKTKQETAAEIREKVKAACPDGLDYTAHHDDASGNMADNTVAVADV